MLQLSIWTSWQRLIVLAVLLCIHLARSESSHHGNFGVELPSFAFDFSEYLVNAIITRQRYVLMTLLGHRIIYEDDPIEAISTDYDNLEHWKQATMHWAKPVKYNVRKGLQHLNCVMRLHDQAHSRPHHVPATWMRISSRALNNTNLYTHFNRHIEALRCPIPSSLRSRLQELAQNNQSLPNIDVDLFRRHHRGDGANDTKTLLISFSVPWQAGYVGYPTAHSVASLATSPVSVPAGSLVACIPGIRLTYRARTKIQRGSMSEAMLLEFIGHLYLHGVDEVYLGVSYSAVEAKTDGAPADEENSAKIEGGRFRALRQLIKRVFPEKRIHLVSMAIPGYDDAFGLPGLQLNDRLAEVLFINQCLNLLKQRGENSLDSSATTKRTSSSSTNTWLWVMSPAQFLLLHHPTSTQGSKFLSLRSALFNSQQGQGWHILADRSAPTNSVLSGSFASTTTAGHTSAHHRPDALDGRKSGHHRTRPHRKDGGEHDGVRRRLLRQDEVMGKERIASDQVCAVHIPSTSFKHVFITDPLQVFHDHGPAPEEFAAQFFSESMPSAVKRDQRLWLFNVDRTLALDISPASGLFPICTLFGPSSTSSQVNIGQLVSTDEVDMHWLHFVSPVTMPHTSTADAQTAGDSGSTAAVTMQRLWQKYMKEEVHRWIADRFDAGAGKVQGLRTTDIVAANTQILRSVLNDTSAGATFTGNAHGRNSMKTKLDIVSPFWRRCDTAHLSTVLQHYFLSPLSHSNSTGDR